MKQALQELRLEWREAGPREAEAVHALHLEATRDMAPELVRQDTREHFQAHLGQQGRTVACHAEGHGMLAYGVLALNSSTVSEMAQLLGLNPSQRTRFAVLDGASVAPRWRGLQLHQGLIRERVALERRCQRTLLAVTAAPGNLPSLRALLSNGFFVAGFARLYRGDARLLLCRDLQAWPQASAEGARQVALSDHAGHQAALAAGLRGLKWVECEGQPQLLYAPCVMQALTPPQPSQAFESHESFT